MAQYIDKDALVAKIKRRFDECSSSILKNYDACKEAKALELGKILTIIDTLEVKNSTHRTTADIESAMQEVEAKSEAYTNAHRGERDDDVLSQMRGEPVSEELEEAAKKHAKCQREDDLECGYDLTKLESFIAGAKWKDEHLMKNVVLETEVLRDSDGDGVDTPCESWLTLADTEIPGLPESLGLEEGDKVKVIIVKED